MLVFPNAKINLGLNIIEKRNDGFHNLSSCFYPVKWCDVLEIIESRKFEFAVNGINIPGKSDQNLCVKAYNLLKKDYQLPNVAIQLHKILPIGAGLGGGSSDATYTLKLLNELFQLFLDDNILELYAEQLGSDCPFFISNKPVIAEGKGEILKPVEIDLSNYFIVIIFPGIDIDTASAYNHVIPSGPDQSISNILKDIPLKEWKKTLKNDFEKSVFLQFPEIKAIKESLYTIGALFASMSGSGSSVYGIFNKQVGSDQFSKRYNIWTGKL
ncbi:4-(cytidine 5'-diphospho)-2-C-methyl-D-erythritol kinase [Bacteroidota bacterium]